MRRVSSTSALASLLVFALSAGADLVVLKDGRTIQTSGPPVLKGRMALLKTPDGKLFSIPAEEIDGPKTEAARLHPTPVPTATPAAPLHEPRPAEIAGKKSGRKATVVLTDDDVAGGTIESEPEQKESGGDRVEVATASVSRTPGGYSIAGTVINTGKVDVSGVGVTIEAVSPELKTVNTTYGQVAKDQLAPGEKSTFTAQMKEPSEVASFRYTAKWQSRIPVKTSPDIERAGEPSPPAKPAEGSEAAGKSEGGAEKPATPGPTPTPTYVRIPSPDVAPRAPNAPIGAPEKPGGTFLPKPTGDQPKPPDGG
jgi:hypothetical protein